MTEAHKKFEYDIALREAHHIKYSDEYFDARPQIAGSDRRKVFEAGFERAWQHQQQRIEVLEKKLELCQALMQSDDKEVIALQGKLKIAVDALEAGEKLIDDISLFLIAAGVPKSKLNYDNDSLLKKALKQIEVK